MPDEIIPEGYMRIGPVAYKLLLEAIKPERLREVERQRRALARAIKNG